MTNYWEFLDKYAKWSTPEKFLPAIRRRGRKKLRLRQFWGGKLNLERHRVKGQKGDLRINILSRREEVDGN